MIAGCAKIDSVKSARELARIKCGKKACSLIRSMNIHISLEILTEQLTNSAKDKIII